ncbi:unnamed protein product [Sympodiomycopsis kandeliae]
MAGQDALPAFYKNLKRPLDYFYIAFFVLHTFASIFVDGEYFYPSLVPQAARDVKTQYLKDSNDPLLGNAGSPEVAWFTLALSLELVFQVPVFVIGAWKLYKDDIGVYPLLIAYATLGSFSTACCLAQVLGGHYDATLTSSNRWSIVEAYGPFTVIPGILLIDMIIRTTSLLSVRRMNTGEAGKSKSA